MRLRTFVEGGGVAKFLLGVNYWPRRSAMYMWQRFDLGEIREDFARIRALGLDVVRFFLQWEAFQPAADRIDRAMLRRLDSVMDALADRKLLAMPSLFTGHMSGVNFLPEWALDRKQPAQRFRTFSGGRELPWGCGDLYGAPLLDAMRLQARAIGERNRNHPALFLWDLGNEFSNLAIPKSTVASNHWCKMLVYELRSTSDAGVTAGNHGEDLTQDRNFRFRDFCEPLACAVMHGYPVYSDFARSADDLNVVPFLCQLTQSFSGKPVLFTEFGNPGGPKGVPEDAMPRYAYGVLDRLQRRGALGAFWWCWADYATELRNTPPFDRAPHELTFGIIRSDGSEKPVAQTLSVFSREGRHAVPPPPPIARENDWFAALPSGVKPAYDAYAQQYDR